MQKAALFLVVFIGTVVNGFAHSPSTIQDNSQVGQMDSGRNVTGPFHRPVIVRNEYGTDDQALLVYKDKMVEMYVPDVTDEHGYMRLLELNHFGTFTTMLYMYDKKTEQTTSYFVGVDAPKKTISVRTDFFATAAVFTFAKAPYAIGQAVLSVANIMQREIALQHIR
jgi:hypothetical protein